MTRSKGRQIQVLGLALMAVVTGAWWWSALPPQKKPVEVQVAPSAAGAGVGSDSPAVQVSQVSRGPARSPAAGPATAEPEFSKLADSTGSPPLHVRLIDDRAQPLAHASFRVEWRPIRTLSGGYAPGRLQSGVFRSGADGRVDLPAGIRLLGGGLVFYGEPERFGIGCMVALPPADELGGMGLLELVIPRPVPVRGRAQSVLPVTDVTVTCWPGGRVDRPLTTGSLGEFVLPGVSPLCRELRFRRMGARDRVQLELVPGGQASSITVELSGGTWVQGVVLDATGNALPGALVRLTQGEAEEGGAGGWGVQGLLGVPAGKTTETDAEGRFVFGLSAPEFDFRLTAIDLAAVSSGEAELEGEVSEGDLVRVVLRVGR